MPNIIFEYNGVQYSTSHKFYDFGYVVLPNGMMLMARGFLESLPPYPASLEVVPDAKCWEISEYTFAEFV